MSEELDAGVSGGKIWTPPDPNQNQGTSTKPKKDRNAIQIVSLVIWAFFSLFTTWLLVDFSNNTYDDVMTNEIWVTNAVLPQMKLVFIGMLVFCLIGSAMNLFLYNYMFRNGLASLKSLPVFTFFWVVIGAFVATNLLLNANDKPVETWLEEKYNYALVEMGEDKEVIVEDLETGEEKTVKYHIVDDVVYLSENETDLIQQLNG